MDDTTPNIRWYHLTPDRFVLALLFIEALLWLSDRFGWWHKGCAVLTAVAAVAVSMLLLLVWLAVAVNRRRRFQFGIRSLLVMTVIVALPSSRMVVETQATKRQTDAVEAIRKMGGQAWYDYEFVGWGIPLKAVKPPGPAWLRKLVGDYFFTEVVAVTLAGAEVTDDKLEPLNDLTELKCASLVGTSITDMGLGHLERCTHLRGLILSHNRGVTDRGLDHLRGLSELRDVGINGTQVTEEGVRRLQKAVACSVNGHTVILTYGSGGTGRPPPD